MVATNRKRARADTIQLATRIQKTQDALFRATTKQLGTTPAAALRVFVAAFNRQRGFPFDLKLAEETDPPVSEDEATDSAQQGSPTTPAG